MRARSSRHGAVRRPRRGAVFSLAALAAIVGTAWLVPSVLVLTDLRDRPLEAAFAGVAGTVSSGAASWNWIGGIEYRDVRLADSAGRPIVAVQRIMVERGLLALMVDPRDLGAVRIVGLHALVEVRRRGSTLEDVLAPWLAARAAGPGGTVAFDLEVLDGAVDVVDLERRDAWRISDLVLAGRVSPSGGTSGWAVSGRLLHAGEPLRDHAVSPATDTVPRRLDRAAIAAAATAALARDGGWTVSLPQPASAAEPGMVAVAGSRVPLGISSVWATRFGAPYVADGLADVRLDIARHASPPASGGTAGAPCQVAGTVAVRQFALCTADSLEDVLVVEHAEAPIDIAWDEHSISIRRFEATSPLFRAEASGRIPVPRGGAWRWADLLSTGDFALAADMNLAAAAGSSAGGFAVRDDVRVTAGQLQISASSRGDGADRLLEFRASARDLAAVQGERQLRWNEPFSAWLRCRRGPGAAAGLRLEEARIASSAVECSATGDERALALQWTVDLDRLVTDAAEVLELDGVKITGTGRGRLDVEAVEGGSTSRARLSTSLAQFSCRGPDLPDWNDEEIVLEAEGSGTVDAGAALVDACHAVLRAGEDRLEITQTGGALVNLAAVVSGHAAAAAISPAPQADGVSADIAITGDLARWQSRIAALVGSGVWSDWKLGGRLEGSAALAIRDPGWQVTRAGVQVEKFTASGHGRSIVEPRIVASGAGSFDPMIGGLRVSSAEILSATVSLRSGGLSLRTSHSDVDLLDRLRGRVQWQADLARLEHWLLPLDVAQAWPAAGRAWGTAEIIDTPGGANLLVDATGNQVALSRQPRGAAAAETLWTEPRVRLGVEVTRPMNPAADRIVVNRLGLDAGAIGLSMAGGIDDVSTRGMMTLAGSATYDLAVVSRLVSPWTGGRVRLAGSGARPVTVRVPLATLLDAVTGEGSGAQTARGAGRPAGATRHREVALPEDWLSTIRPRDQAVDPGAVTPMDRPAAPATLGAAPWLHSVSAETSAAWDAADVDGVRIDPGALDLRLFEGQLAFGPFELAAGGGRLRGAPWIRLVPPPGELVVPPGRVIDRVALSSRFCEEWMSWAVPLIGRSTRTQGVVSVDVSGARVPLGDPFGGEFNGQLVFENTEVSPGAHLGPLATLMVKLQTLVDPRFAFGDRVVLLRVRPEPVRLRLVDRRLWHDGLVLEMGQLVIRSAGNVGSDGTLAMAAEVSFRGDLAGSTPVIGQLLRTPLVIPLKGTVQRPQFDAAAIDAILGRIVENTAEAVITDGLERILGAPRPPASGPSP